VMVSLPAAFHGNFGLRNPGDALSPKIVCATPRVSTTIPRLGVGRSIHVRVEMLVNACKQRTGCSPDRYTFVVAAEADLGDRKSCEGQNGSEKKLVGLGRLELPTSPLSGVRSSHLSYRPSVRAFYHRPSRHRQRIRFRRRRLAILSRLLRRNKNSNVGAEFPPKRVKICFLAVVTQVTDESFFPTLGYGTLLRVPSRPVRGSEPLCSVVPGGE
jgi:hypothetical protein